MADKTANYKIVVKTDGTPEINSLAGKVEALAKTLDGDLKVKAEGAAKALRELDAKNAAASGFFELKQRTQDAAAALADAQAKAQALSKALAATDAPTKTQARAMEQLRAAVGTAKNEVIASTQALDAGRVKLTQYGLSTDGLAQSQQRIKNELQLAKIQAQGMTGSYGTLSTGAREAALASDKAAGGLQAVGAASQTVSGLLRTLGPLMAGAFSAQHFLGVITSAESLSRSYEQIFGSVSRARQEMEFIKVTANTLGMETLDLAKSYQSLAAATRGTTLEGQATRDVFEAVTRAMSMMGKSSDETKNALNAVAQMSSKGTVAMEELRGQLGEALPGALSATAKGAGITTEQLVAMVSNGNVLAKDMLPALAKGLNSLYANAPPPQTVISEWARFKNVVTETSIAIGEGGASQGIAKALSGVAVAAKYAALGVDILGTSIGEGAAALVTWDGSLTTSQDLAKKYGIEQVGAAAATDKHTTAIKGNTEAAKENFRQMELLAQKQTENSLVIQARYTELITGSAQYTAQVTKEVQARQAESELLTKLVSGYGTEAEKRQMAAQAATVQADALAKLAQAQNVEVVMATSYVLKLQEQAKATNDTSEATQKAIQEAQKNVAAKQTEYEKTQALSNAKKIETEITRANEQALKDNTSRVFEYQSAVVRATTEVERLTKAHLAGKATDDEVIAAKAKLAAATLLYRDALADASAKAEAALITDQRSAQLIQASISVDMERVKAAQEVAAAQGDTTKATQLATQATALQVQASRDAAEAARAEAQDIRDLADKKEAEYLAIGKLTEAQKQDISARRQSADLKELEAQKLDILTEKILALARANNSETASLEAKNAAIERVNAATEKAIKLENKRLNRDKEGFSLNTAGQRVNMLIQSQRSVFEQAKSQGLSEADALKIAKQFISDNGQKQGWNGDGAMQGKNWGTALQEAIDKIVLANAAKNANTDVTRPPPNAPGGGVITTVIDLRTTTGTFSVPTNDGGARALLDALKAAKGVAA